MASVVSDGALTQPPTLVCRKLLLVNKGVKSHTPQCADVVMELALAFDEDKVKEVACFGLAHGL